MYATTVEYLVSERQQTMRAEAAQERRGRQHGSAGRGARIAALVGRRWHG